MDTKLDTLLRESVTRFHDRGDYGLTGVTLELAGYDMGHASAVVRVMCKDCGRTMTTATTHTGGVRMTAYNLRRYWCEH